MNKYSEAEIIEGCRQEKPFFQDKLYQLYSGRMMAICLRYIPSRYEAEDVFHEAFVKVFKNLKHFRDGSFEGWMRRIFVNTSINSYYKNKRYKAQLDYAELENITPTDEDVVSQLSSHELLSYINRLPDGYRIVFNLYVIEGYNHREIGEMLGISEGTSKSQMSKAKAYLKKVIQQNIISERC